MVQIQQRRKRARLSNSFFNSLTKQEKLESIKIQMEFFDEFEIIGGMIPNLIGLAFFCGVIIYFDQTRKAKVKRGEKVPPHQ